MNFAKPQPNSSRLKVLLAVDRSQEKLFVDFLRLNPAVEIVARVSSGAELEKSLKKSTAELLLLSPSLSQFGSELIQTADQHRLRIATVITSKAEQELSLRYGLYELLLLDTNWQSRLTEIMVSTRSKQPWDNSGISQLAAQASAKNSLESPSSVLAWEGQASQSWGLKSVNLQTLPERAKLNSGVIAVWGPAGSPGRSTLAVNLAAELSSDGANVALIDADSYSASTALMLGVSDESSSLAKACRLASVSTITEGELAKIFQEVPGYPQLSLLSGITNWNRWPELSEDRVKAVIQSCRTSFDYTVIDCSFSLETENSATAEMFTPKRNGATLAALSTADRILAVGSADPIGISRYIRAMIELEEKYQSEIIIPVINKFREKSHSLGSVKQLSRVLERFAGLVVNHFLPWDPDSCFRSIEQGIPLREVSDSRRLSFAIRNLIATELG